MVDFNLQEESQQLADPSSYAFEDELDSHQVSSLLEGTSGHSNVFSIADMATTDAIISLASTSDAISHPGSPSTFAIFRSALKHADALPPSTLPKILDSLLSAMSSELDATVRNLNLNHPPQDPYADRDDNDVDRSVIDAHKTALEMYAFLILWLVGVGEKVRAVDEEGAVPSTTKARKTSKGSTAAKATAKSKKKSNSWTWADQIPSVLSLLGRVLKLLPSAKVWTSTADRDSFIGYLFPRLHTCSWID